MFDVIRERREFLGRDDPPREAFLQAILNLAEGPERIVEELDDGAGGKAAESFSEVAAGGAATVAGQRIAVVAQFVGDDAAVAAQAATWQLTPGGLQE